MMREEKKSDGSKSEKEEARMILIITEFIEVAMNDKGQFLSLSLTLYFRAFYMVGGCDCVCLRESMKEKDSTGLETLQRIGTLHKHKPVFSWREMLLNRKSDDEFFLLLFRVRELDKEKEDKRDFKVRHITHCISQIHLNTLRTVSLGTC